MALGHGNAWRDQATAAIRCKSVTGRLAGQATSASELAYLKEFSNEWTVEKFQRVERC